MKIVSLLLAVSMLAGIFVSCKKDGPKKEGDIMVIYNGTPVYESELQDIINYTLSRKMNQQTTTEEMKIMMGESIGTYVQFKIIELDFNEKGIEVDEKAVKARYEQEKEGIEESYEGGYQAWMEDYGVSEYFLKEEVRRYILTDMYFNQVKDDITVSEEEMRKYMNLHASDYYHPAGYEWTMIFREVKDITDETECATAEAEAQEYINKIAAGTLTLEDAKNELLAKYTAKDGYNKATIYNGSDFTSYEDMPLVQTKEQFDALLAEMENVYADRDPEADKNSQQYANYMHWVAECFEAETYYALQNLEEGTVYAKPIKNFIGYAIVRLDAVSEETYFDSFDDVKNELFLYVLEEKLQQSLIDYTNELHEKYDVQYLYTSL
ncbi:MAG: hypothetical protein IJ489_08030 [Clostridia bacterium]|nr:hypothetical protein [Clostridia bacterium]